MNDEHFSQDIAEFIRLLAYYRVRYLIVGGEAVIYYGHARLTEEVDFFYDAASGNAHTLFLTLKDFWKGQIPGVSSPGELQVQGAIIQFAVSPKRIVLINSVSAIAFPEAWEKKTTDKMSIKGEEFPVYFIGLEQLIRNKKSVGRYKDLDDLAYLEEVLQKRR